MKSRLLSIITGMLVTCQLYSQSPCTNGTQTDPNHPVPSTSSFKKNTFNWMQSTFPIEKSDYHNFAPYVSNNPLYSPFYSTANYIGYIAGGASSDFKPEDGWELIKQDFGYIYGSSQWNGSPIASTYGYNKPLAYFMLYNKYTGKLRILATTNKQGNISDDKVLVTLSLINPSAGNYSGSNFTGYAGNGIFAHTSAVASPLDHITTNNKVTSIAAYPASTQDFFYVDFQLSYDPCVCFFKSGIEVSFATQTNATVSLSGLLVGTNQTLASITNGQGSIKGDNPGSEFYYNQFLTDENGNALSVSQTYEELLKFKHELETTGGLSQGLENMDDALKGVAVIGSFDPEVKEAVEIMSTILDFMVVLAGEHETPPTVITANMALTGTITGTGNAWGWDYRFAVPASQGASSLDEYSTVSPNGTKPYYPMYNEPVGMFALLQTPHVKRKLKGSENTGVGENVEFLNQRSFYQLDLSSIKYAFSQVVDASATTIDVAIEVNGKENNGHFTNPEYTNAHYYATRGNFERIRTDFFPLGCMGKIIVKEKSDYAANVGFLIDDMAMRLNDRTAFLIMNIYYVFKTDIYGKKHYGVQTLKYPIAVDDVQDDLEAIPDFAALRDIPFNLVINSTTFTTPQKIYSRGTITINGDLINNSGGTIEIIGENGVQHISGFRDKDIVLKNGTVASFFCDGSTPIPPESDINGYCASTLYKASQFEALTVPSGKGGFGNSLTQRTFKVDLYPNPASAGVNLNIYSFNYSEDFSVFVFDMNGKLLSTIPQYDMVNGGYINTADLAPGVYFVKVVNNINNEQISNKFIVTHD